MKKATRIMSWTMTVATAGWLAMPVQVASAATYRYSWVSQTPSAVTSDGTAHYVNANAGDTVAMSVTLTNKSSVTIKGKTALGAIPAGKQVQPGAWAIGVRGDAATPWLDASSFVLNGNRFVYYDGPDVAPGANFTVSWNVKVASTAANGTYNLYFRPVAEYVAWTSQVAWNGTVLSQNKADIFTRFYIGGGAPVTPSTGGLSVGIASGTPAAGNIATNATSGGAANFTKITLTPSAGASVSLTQLLVTRGGLSTDGQVQNVKMVRASDNVQVGGTAGGFNALHKAQIFFSPALVISAPTDFYLRAGVATTPTAVSGNTISLGIASNSDIISNATSVTGAPIGGNLMTIISLAIGSIDVIKFGSVANSTPDVGETNVVVNQFQLTAGSTEDVWVDQISVLRTGTAASDDTANIELVNDTTATSVGTVASWVSDRATWNFSPALKISQGGNVRFTVRLDIVDGSGLNVNADIEDGSDMLVVARGDLYGYFFTPTDSGAWNGAGDNAQVINAGSMTIAKSASSAPTGNVAIADNQALGTWDFTVLGEDMRITALSVNLGGTATTASEAEVVATFKNARIYDESGTIVAGPLDAAATAAGDGTGTALDRDLDFTQTFIAPVGVHKYTLKVRIIGTLVDATGAQDGETITSTITATGDVTVKGVRTNTAVNATVTNSTLNTMTVNTGSLVSTTLTQPAPRSVVANQQNFVFSTHSFDASGSGEDVLITAAQFDIDITDDGDANEDVNQITGVELWADLTTANETTRGDAFETRISDAQDLTATAVNTDLSDFVITFNQTLTVAKGSFVKIAFVGDLASDLDTNDTVAISLSNDASDVTAVGKDTGTAITTAPNAGGEVGSTMTFATVGALTFSVDSSSPLKSIMVGNALKQKVGVFKIAASNVENIELDDLVFAETDLGVAGDVLKYYAYSDKNGSGTAPVVGNPGYEAGYGIKIGEAPSASATTFTITIPDGYTTVPANGHALITIYADVAAVDGGAGGVNNGDNLNVGIEGTGTDLDQFNATGLSSGSNAVTTNNFGDLEADTHEIMKSKLTISVASTSPAGALVPGALSLCAEFAFTADVAADISFRAGSDERLILSIDSVVADVGAGTTDDVSIVRKSTGVTLDTNNDDTGGADSDGAFNAVTPETSTITFNFSTTALTIAAGTTEIIQVFVDTDDFEDIGDSLRVWLDDTAANVTYGTEGGDNEVALGDVIARGDIRANVLQKP